MFKRNKETICVALALLVIVIMAFIQSLNPANIL